MKKISECKIMIVDDDPVVIRLVGSILKTAGYSITSARDGLEALVKIKAEKPDLVILDIMMPEINGYDVCYQLRFNADYERVPILLLTAREKELEDNVALRANIEYLLKPADPELLLDKVSYLLSLK